jgi:flagellar basal body P-ring protein FlgI
MLRNTLAKSALKKLDVKTAELAFIKSNDFYGIDFLKKLQNITVSLDLNKKIIIIKFQELNYSVELI